jgi:dihydrolipoamide dehydrogenase
VGVSTNLENIGIEALNIATDKGKVTVDPYYKTNVDGVYAIGDIVPGQALAHVAMKEAVICIEAIANKEGKYSHLPEHLDYGNVPGCTYCTPEIASVGMTEKQAKEAGYEVKVGKFPFSASGKASAAGANEGFVKVVLDAKYGEWLGCHMIGANVTEIIAETVTARKLETTYHEQLDTIFPHPTMSEAVKDAIEVALGEAIHL